MVSFLVPTKRSQWSASRARDGHKFESSMYITPTCCHYLFVCRSIRLDGPLSLFCAQTSALIAPLEVLLQDSHVCLLCWRYQPGTRWDRWDQNSSCLAGKRGLNQPKKKIASGSFTVLVPAKRHATLGLEPCLGGWLLWDPQRSSPSPYRSPPKNGFRLRDQYRCMMDALLIWSRYDVPMLFQIVKPTGLGPLPLKPGTWHLRCPWTNRCGSEEGCRGWFQPAQPASHHPATRHGGANGRCQGNQGHPCKDGRTFTWRLTLETWGIGPPHPLEKNQQFLWFRHETVGIHFLPWAGNRPGHQQKGLYAFFCWNNNSWKHSWTFHIPFACDSTLQSRNAHHAHQTQLSLTFDHFIGLFPAVVNCPAICVKMVPLNPLSYCRSTPHFRHTQTSYCFIHPPIKYDKVIYPHEFGFPQIFGMLWYHKPCPMAAIGHEDVKLTLHRPRRMQVKLRKEVPK